MWNLANWGKVLISFVVVFGFISVTVLYLTTKIEGTPTPEILSILLGALATNFTSVVQHWVGSSAGSSGKDEIIKDMAIKSITP